MGLVDRLRAIVYPMPADASVTLSVSWLRDLLAAEDESPGMDRLLTLEEAGEVVGRSPSTIRTWLNTGLLDGFKLNARSWRIRETALQRFIEDQQSGGHDPPTVRGVGPVDLSAWREHVTPEKGVS